MIFKNYLGVSNMCKMKIWRRLHKSFKNFCRISTPVKFKEYVKSISWIYITSEIIEKILRF